MHPNPAYRQAAETRALDFAARRGFGAITATGPASYPSFQKVT